MGVGEVVERGCGVCRMVWVGDVDWCLTPRWEGVVDLKGG